MFDTIALAIAWGLIIGSIYTIAALGLTIIFGVTKIVNFVHGDFMIVAAYITLLIWMLGPSPYLGIPFAMAFLALIAIPVYKQVFKPLTFRATKLHELAVCVGLIFIVQNVLAHTFTSVHQRIVTPFTYEHIKFLVLSLPYDIIIALVLTGCLLVLMHIFITKTLLGKALEAVSEEREGSRIVGINIERIELLSFIIGLMLAGIGGSLLSLLFTFGPYDGTIMAVKAFAITIFGGMGNIPGTIMAGFFYGLVESFTGAFLGGSWKEPVAFILMVAVLAFRPQGLFARAR